MGDHGHPPLQAPAAGIAGRQGDRQPAGDRRRPGQRPRHGLLGHRVGAPADQVGADLGQPADQVRVAERHEHRRPLAGGARDERRERGRQADRAAARDRPVGGGEDGHRVPRGWRRPRSRSSPAPLAGQSRASVTPKPCARSSAASAMPTVRFSSSA